MMPPDRSGARTGCGRCAAAPRIRHALAQGPRLAGRALIAAYRHSLSGLIGSECRHLPTCSDYADQALGRFGLWTGGWMTLARLCRCHPWGTSGLDFVPQAVAANARWFLPWRYGRWRRVYDPALEVRPAPSRTAGQSEG